MKYILTTTSTPMFFPQRNQLIFCSVAGLMAWNALPDDLRDPSLSADSFRKKLKTHLFRNALGHLAH